MLRVGCKGSGESCGCRALCRETHTKREDADHIVGISEIVESIGLTGLLASHVVIDSYGDHVRHVIGLRERSSQLCRPNPDVMHRGCGRTMPGPLHDLDERHALGTPAKAVTAEARPRWLGDHATAVTPRHPCLPHSRGMIVLFSTTDRPFDPETERGSAPVRTCVRRGERPDLADAVSPCIGSYPSRWLRRA